MGFDDYDTRISIEEMYIGLIDCEICFRPTMPNQIHIMQSFDKGVPDIILCDSCYNDMLGEKIND